MLTGLVRPSLGWAFLPKRSSRKGVSFFSILLLALALAMDATAVAASRGLAAQQVTLTHAVRVALFFGGSQALMPLLGYYLGTVLGRFAAAWDHWIAFALLAAIGLKMLWDARPSQAEGNDEKPGARDPFGLRVMMVLALATSIDALAAGVTLPLVGAPLLLTLVTIGVTTAALSVLGLYAGKRLGDLFGRRLDAIAGLVLIGLGVKVILSHLLAP